MAWEMLIFKHSYLPGFDALGLTAGQAEQVDMANGVYLSPVMTQTFTNPQTGQFDPEMQRQFVSGIDADPSGNASTIWNYLKEQSFNQRVMSKYLSLVTQGMNVSAADLQRGVDDAGATVNGRYISQSYTTIADSLIKVSDSDIRAYYRDNKERFRQQESRGIEYVLFDMLPSDADFAEAAERVADIAAEFEAAEDPMQYAQANSQQNPDTRFVSPASLDTSLAGLVSGSEKMVGPTLRGQEYTISRLAATRMMPDTLGAKHILLPATSATLADSLVTVLRRGSDFAALSAEFSIDPGAQTQGGDLGRFAPEQMIPEFSEACIAASRGDIFTVNSQYGLHVVQLTYKTAPTLKAQIATVVYTVDPSPATEQSIYSNASSFAAAAAGSTEKFRDAASTEGLSPRIARISGTESNVQGLNNSRELVRWAFTANQGNTSTILDIDGDYVVANLNEVRHQGTAPVQQVASDIRMMLVQKEKGRMIAEKMSAAGSTLDAAATDLGVEATLVNDLQYGAFFLDGPAGMEMKLIGAMSAGRTTGQLSKPVEGSTGVFLFDITGVAMLDSNAPESEKVRLEAAAQSYIAERVNMALLEESEITDSRAKYF
jgi:peptidyl-prolyl cis-trans isomerase D